ncbi:hypothetical protein ONA92_26735 [Mycobacteroides salmoniphilum]|uniref:hypothetical protein n=1 Tax=Mycobacteroides salmoniphilum TaxID=404941 RepID=UPI003567ECA1
MSAGPHFTAADSGESGGEATVFLLPHPELRGALKFLALGFLTAFYAVNSAAGTELDGIPFLLRGTFAVILSALSWACMKLAVGKWRTYRDYRRLGPYIERIPSTQPPPQGETNG